MEEKKPEIKEQKKLTDQEIIQLYNKAKDNTLHFFKKLQNLKMNYPELIQS